MTSPTLDRIRTLLVDALNASAVVKKGREAIYGAERDIIGIRGNKHLWQGYDADRLATTILNTITAIVLDREAVRAALIQAITSVLKDNRDFVHEGRKWDHETLEDTGPIILGVDGSLNTDDLVDRLIASLAGGPSS